jgi:NAD(P)H-dependent FMN reductase
MLKISILYSGVRNNRLSIRAARAVEKAFRHTGKTDLTFIDIVDYHLPVMEDRLKDMETPDARLLELSRLLAESDGLVLVSPEYNNSYSGALKNTVDYFTKEWAQKPIGVVAASAGGQGGINASNLMQLLVLAVQGYAMPTKLLVPELGKNLNEQGETDNVNLKKNIDKFVTEFLWFTEAIANHKK